MMTEVKDVYRHRKPRHVNEAANRMALRRAQPNFEEPNFKETADMQAEALSKPRRRKR